MLVSATLDRMVTRQINDPDELVDFREIMDSIVQDSNGILSRSFVFEMNISMITSLKQVQSRKYQV